MTAADLWALCVAGLIVVAVLCAWSVVSVVVGVLVGRVLATQRTEDAQTAADFGEPTRTQVEAQWTDTALDRLLTAIDNVPSGLDTDPEWRLFPAPEFRDTPIYQAMRHEADVWFAAEVLADIDDLPEVRHG